MRCILLHLMSGGYIVLHLPMGPISVSTLKRRSSSLKWGARGGVRLYPYTLLDLDPNTWFPVRRSIDFEYRSARTRGSIKPTKNSPCNRVGHGLHYDRRSRDESLEREQTEIHMKFPKGCYQHECSPQEFRRSPNITGLPSLDRAIWANPSPTMADRLKDYVSCEDGLTVYGLENAYHGYSRDE